MDFSQVKIEDVLQNKNGIFDLLKNGANWNGIPMLNYVQLQDFPDHSFVRFRGMIQDMLDPEIYFERFQTYIKGGGIKSLQSGKYRDTISLQVRSIHTEGSICKEYFNKRNVCLCSFCLGG